MEEIYERLDRALEQYTNDEAACVLDVSELDGFFHALACSPAPVAEADWSIAIWGGEAFLPRWPDAAAAQQFNQDARAHHANVMQGLGRGECAPVYLNGEDEAGQECMIVDAWCEGFLLGMQLWPEGVAEPPEELLEPILFFTVDLDEPELSEQVRASTSQEETELLQELLPQCVFGLREFYGLNAAPERPAPGRSKPGKPGGKSRTRR